MAYGTEWSDNKKTSDSYGLWLRNGTEWSDNKKTSDSYGLWHGVARQQENIWFLSHIAHLMFEHQHWVCNGV